MQKEKSNDNLILDKDNNLNNITYYTNSNTSTKYDDSNINNSILKLSKHIHKNINCAKKDFDKFFLGTENFKINQNPKILRKILIKIAYTTKIRMIVHVTSIRIYPYYRHRA